MHLPSVACAQASVSCLAGRSRSTRVQTCLRSFRKASGITQPQQRLMCREVSSQHDASKSYLRFTFSLRGAYADVEGCSCLLRGWSLQCMGGAGLSGWAVVLRSQVVPCEGCDKANLDWRPDCGKALAQTSGTRLHVTWLQRRALRWVRASVQVDSWVAV